MKAKARNVGEYLQELERSKEGRPEQVKDGLQIYIDLWMKAIQKGILSSEDNVESALEKIDAKGGLYKAAED
ncbi:MAG: hypothetical protein OK404_00950 [Thaumarchaeota archaeon]|nr:hypothetical protein [Nitrososphaerota archaeon]